MPLMDQSDLTRTLNTARAAAGTKEGQGLDTAILAATILAVAINDAAHAITTAISGLKEALRSDHPLQGETLGGLTAAMEAIATAIEGHGRQESAPAKPRKRAPAKKARP